MQKRWKENSWESLEDITKGRSALKLEWFIGLSRWGVNPPIGVIDAFFGA
jgi:hypothetical protein